MGLSTFSNAQHFRNTCLLESVPELVFCSFCRLLQCNYVGNVRKCARISRVKNNMFLGGGIYTISEDDEETYEERITNGYSDESTKSKRSEKRVHFAVRFFENFYNNRIPYLHISKP